MLSLLALTSLFACNQGKLTGKGLDDTGGDGGSVADGGSGDGGTTSDGGSTDGGGTDGGGSDGGSDGGSACGVTVLSSSPTSGASGVQLGTAVSFTLSDSDSTATLSVAAVSGGTVAGSFWLSDSDTVVWFQPSAPLAGSTEYVATLEWCDGSDPVSFTTLDPGTPVSGLDGTGYILDLVGATWVEPAGVGSMLSGYLTSELMLGVSSTSATTIEMYSGLGDGAGNQDTCSPTIDFPAASFTENPYFQLGPTDVSFDVSGTAVSLSDFRFSGTFSADKSRIDGGTVTAELDIRVLAPFLGGVLGTTDPATLCSYLSFLGATCSDCTGDGQPYCLPVDIEDVQGTRMSDPLAVVTQQDCYPTCAASYSNPDCDTSGF